MPKTSCQFPMGMVHSSALRAQETKSFCVNSLWVWFTIVLMDDGSRIPLDNVSIPYGYGSRLAAQTTRIASIRRRVNSLWVWFTEQKIVTAKQMQDFMCQFPMGMVHLENVVGTTVLTLTEKCQFPMGMVHEKIPYGYGSQPPLLCGRHMIPHFPAKNHLKFRSVQRVPAQYEIVKTTLWEPDLVILREILKLVVLIDQKNKQCKRFLSSKIWSISFLAAQKLQ